MGIFCPPDIFDNCNPRTVLQDIMNNLCTAECTWDNIRVAECNTPTNTWDALWTNCVTPPPNRLVIMDCPAGPVLYYYDDDSGDYLPMVETEVRVAAPAQSPLTFDALFPNNAPSPTGAVVIRPDATDTCIEIYGNTGAAWRQLCVNNEFRVIYSCAAVGDGPLFAAFDPLGPPSTGAHVYVHCGGSGVDRKYYYSPASGTWEIMEDITSRSIGTGGISGDYCTTSTLGATMPFNVGLSNPFQIRVPNVPGGWNMWVGISGYFFSGLCNGFIDLYVDGIQVSRYYFFITASPLSNPDMTSTMFNFVGAPGLHNIEIRAGRDTTINPCASGTQACWNSFAIQTWLEPSTTGLPNEW